MQTGVQISVEDYLSTSYRPDCEYVDGVLLERNLGEFDHSRLQGPPFLCVEILSKDDKMSEMLEGVKDSLDFEVPNVWIVDPGTWRARMYTRAGIQEAADRVLRATNSRIAGPLSEIFE